MTKIQSVDRDKFMIRFDNDETRHKVQGAANKEHTSMNSWIQVAIDEKLGRGERIDRLLDLAALSIDK